MATATHIRARGLAAPVARNADVGRWLPVGAVVTVTAYLALVPVLFLAWGSLRDAPPGADGTFTLQNYVQAYGNASVWQMLLNTAWFAAGSSALAMALGTGFAWLVERTNLPFRNAWYVLSLVPLMLPGVLEAIAWQLLLAPRSGWINVQLRTWLGLPALDIYSIGGMIWVQGVSMVPLVFIMLAASFRSMDAALEEASHMSGGSTWTTLRRVTLPLMLPGLLAAFLLSLIRAVEAFELPAFIGLRAGLPVFTTEIYTAITRVPPNFGYGTALAMTFLVLTTAAVLFYQRVVRGANRFSTVTGKGYRPRPILLGPARWPMCALFACYFVITIGLPLFILLWSSLLSFYAVPNFNQLPRMSLNNYSALWSYPNVADAVFNSVILATGTATGAMLLTSVCAWIVVRTRLPGRHLVDLLAFSPYAMPGIVLGVALLWTYAILPLPVYGTLLILLVAYVTRYMPYGIRSTSATLVQIHRELEEAAAMSGSGWWHTFSRVTLPLLRSGFIAGWLYIFMLAVKELSMSLLLYPPGKEVLSVIIWELWDGGKPELVSALGVLMLLGLGALAVLVRRLGFSER